MKRMFTDGPAGADAGMTTDTAETNGTETESDCIISRRPTATVGRGNSLPDSKSGFPASVLTHRSVRVIWDRGQVVLDGFAQVPSREYPPDEWRIPAILSSSDTVHALSEKNDTPHVSKHVPVATDEFPTTHTGLAPIPICISTRVNVSVSTRIASARIRMTTEAETVNKLRKNF